MSARGLEAECASLVRYLTGDLPDPYVVGKYVAAHGARPELAAAARFDRALLRVSRAGRFATRIADSHARIFAPGSALRRKLILLLAILETSPAWFRRIDDPGPGPPALVPLRLVLHGLRAATALLAGSAVLLPVQLVCRLTDGTK